MMETLQYPKELKAKKEHKCSFCLQTITKGDIYERSVYKAEGKVYSWKSHVDCSSVAKKLRMFDDCDEGVTAYDFSEYINEAYNKICDPEEDINVPFPAKLNIVVDHYLNKADQAGY